MPNISPASSSQQSPLPPPGASASALAGAEQRQQLTAIARKVMGDHLLKRQLAERVLQLMHEDLKQQHQRIHSYGGKF